MKNKSTLLSFIISFLVVGSLIAVFTLSSGNKGSDSGADSTQGNQGTAASGSVSGDGNGGENGSAGLAPEDETPSGPSKPMDLKGIQGSPEKLISAVAGYLRGLNDEEMDALAEHRIMDRATLAKIKIAVDSKKLVLSSLNPMQQIGSWDGGNMVRYRLNFEGGLSGIVDLQKGADNLWSVHSITLPDPDGDKNIEMKDAMGVTERFVKATLGTDFSTARSLVMPEHVSNATLAGLCILFEEGEYSLRPENSIKGMFSGGNNAGFLVYLNNAKGAESCNMGVTLKRSSEKGWLVSEVSLDSLLASYIKEVAAGEDVYVPLVKNPQGGDSLVLLFGFNEATLTPRSVKQLEIVAKIVQAGDSKKLEISGHTDDVGSERYNQGLSEARAAAVKAALVAAGVPEDKIVTKAFGKTQPRRTFDSDDTEIQRDEARRANRRAEMYLDF